jgi:hypothetical protein
MATKLIYISALVPQRGADCYGGVRISVFDSERDAHLDLLEWLSIDQEGWEQMASPSNEEIANALNESEQVLAWNIEEQAVEMSTVLKSNREEIQEALDAAAAAQTVFWEALRELEETLGDDVDIDSTSDLEGRTVDDLIEEYAEKTEGVDG